MFLHKVFHKYFKVSNIISKDLNIISICITSSEKYGKFKPKLKFNDSICIFPSSLDKLATSFKVETSKEHFPYSFVNESKINYIGCVPDINLFNNNNKKS